MYESMRRFCIQDCPSYEIIFGVSDPDDLAVELVDYLRLQFPKRTIRLVICQNRLGNNPKVNSLAQMLPEARHDALVISDSDIRVEADYLWRVVAPLVNPNVGMVTCLYRGVAGSTLASRIESVGINTDFAGGILVAHVMEGGLHFGLGSTLALRRRSRRIGGFKPFLNDLADDYEIGRRIADQRFEVRLSDAVVETSLPPYTLRQFFAHQLRWARSTRESRPYGYFGLLLTFGWLWAVLAVIVGHTALWTLQMFCVSVVFRAAAALVIGRVVLHDREAVRHLGLTPLRELVALLVWVASFVGNTVTWRGESFFLRNGKLLQIAPKVRDIGAGSVSKQPSLRRKSFFLW
jgi:ceramide glucosyltransferase